MDSLNFKAIPYELIVGEMEGTLSEDDVRRLSDWINISEENRCAYEKAVRMISDIDLLAEYRTVSVEDAWKRLDFNANVADDNAQTINVKSRYVYIRPFISIAAVFLAALMLYLFYFKQDKEVLLQTGDQQSLVQTLPDGTQLILGQNTEVAFSERSFKKNRSIEVKKGRVFIDIGELASAGQFKVLTEDLLITDIGTSFSVSVQPEKTVVNVATGIVSMAGKGKSSSESLILKSNEIGVYEKKRAVFKRDSVDQLNFVSWHDKKVRFTDASLEQIANALMEAYQVKITFSEEKLKDRRWGGYFENTPIDDILASIATTLDLRIAKDEYGYVLSN